MFSFTFLNNTECSAKYSYLDSFYTSFMYKILRPCYIVASCQITELSFLADFISCIYIEVIRIASFVPIEVHWTLTPIFFSTLQSLSTVKSDPHKNILRFITSHLTTATSPTKMCFEISSGDTNDIEIK